MSDGIMRAGPFASSSGFFVDEPSPANDLIVPVNCSNSSSATWPWRVFKSTDSTNVSASLSYETVGGSIISLVTDSGDNPLESTNELSFYYQATQSFILTVDYNLSYTTAVGTNTSVDIFIFVNNSTVFTDFDAQSGSSSISGTYDINLVATVVPIKVRILAFSGGEVPLLPTTGSTSLSVTISGINAP